MMYKGCSQYRFVSVDSAVTKRLVQLEPQKWHFYVYCLDNPISFFDSTGRWPASSHYGQTYSIAIFLNMSKSLAHEISQACMDVDLAWATTAGDLKRPWTILAAFVNDINGNQAKWHFPDAARLDECFRICLTTLDPKVFGKNLHVIQDYYSHYAYIGDFFGHALDTSVDDPNKHPAAYEAMCWMTLELMTEFYDRLISAAVVAATQVATSIGIILGGI